MQKTLIGNASAREHLSHLISKGTVSHTLLFTGPNGVGKSLFAQEFAMALMGISDSNHPDLRHYLPVGKSGMHSMESIHELQQNLAHSAFEARCKVAIVHAAERMLPTSSNALLKTLEEPTPNSFIILLSDDVDSLLPTIVSRCQKISFSPIEEATLAAHISATWNKTPEEAVHLARLSGGSLGRAALLVSDRWQKIFSELLTLLHGTDQAQLLKTLTRWEEEFGQIAEDPEHSWVEHVDLLFSLILFWYRDCAVLAMGGNKATLFYPEAHCLARPVALESVLELAEHCRTAVQQNVKLRTALHHFFTKSLT